MKKILLLGSGELGREFVIAAKRAGQYVVACDRYDNAPAMQVADEREVFSMLDGDALAAVVNKHKPDIIVPEIEAIRTERLFEFEVPEIASGVVQIKSIAREPGSRTKMAVFSTDLSIDPVGACVGPRGMRVEKVVAELKVEKIDIIRWSSDPAEFIANALNPARVLSVQVSEKEKAARVVVPDNQLSLAIGKEGQNARLAAKLTGWKIDIKSQSQMEEVLQQEAEEQAEAPAEEN